VPQSYNSKQYIKAALSNVQREGWYKAHPSDMSLHFILTRVPRAFFMAVALAWFVTAPLLWARTDAVADASRLLARQQYSAALSALENHLSASPRDPQGRFLLGVAQTRLGQTAQALQTYLQLTEDFPELPEPYNNMAVLYAEQNQWERARATLEMAIRTKPDFASAHENLGNVYLQLAQNAYQQALAVDKTRSALGRRLLQLQRLGAPHLEVTPAAPR
jgi:Flp pilus assembly protein TadD